MILEFKIFSVTPITLLHSYDNSLHGAALVSTTSNFTILRRQISQIGVTHVGEFIATPSIVTSSINYLNPSKSVAVKHPLGRVTPFIAMIDYQPLDAAKNEIRLLFFKNSSNDPRSSSGTANLDPQAVVQVEMRTVSLDDYTENSRNFMAARKSTKYSFLDYMSPDHPSKIVIDSQSERVEWLEGVKTEVDELYNRPDFGRWTWGDYATLSYTWGDIRETRPIKVNGHLMEVGTNLEDFLREYIANNEEQSPGQQRMGFWVDAICINQNDLEERNTQVKRMGDIYSGASGTTAWLGKATDDVGKAMDMIDSVAQHIFTKREEMAVYMKSMLQNSMFGHESWRAFASLLSRTYWTRLWIVQEIALSQNSLNVVWGDREINWPQFLNVIDTFSNDLSGLLAAIEEAYEEAPVLENPGPDGDEVANFGNNLNRIQQFGIYRGVLADGQANVRLGQLLSISRGSKQTNPRDKVYGILGLVDPELSKLISPNYALSTSEIFTDFAKAAILSSKSLDIIIYQGKQGPEQTLPSWVPDLMEEVAVDEMTLSVQYGAAKDSAAVVSFGKEQLIARGLIIDIIDGLGGSLANLIDDDEDETVLQPVHVETPYQGQAGIRDALWRTMFVDRDGVGNIVPESYARILEVPWEDDEDDEDDEEVKSAFQDVWNAWRRMNSELQFGGQDFKSHFPAKSEEEFEMPELSPGLDPFHRIFSVALGRRLIVTAKGYLGQARAEAQRGDLVCVLLGCSVPVILRPRSDGCSYRLVGDSYVHGIMNGEAIDWLDQGLHKLEDLTIC